MLVSASKFFKDSKDHGKSMADRDPGFGIGHNLWPREAGGK